MIELERLYRAERARLLSALICDLGDFDVAEEALQEAFACAAAEWPAAQPRSPRAWLYGTARHRALDRLRRRARFRDKQPEVLQSALLAEEEARAGENVEEAEVPDERLRLIFTCCHPALALEAQVALTLHTLGGLSTTEIARAFLLPATTLAQRLVRAKAKILKAAIPYVVPPLAELPERQDAVMTVLYLIFNEGYAAAGGEAALKRELCLEAIRLARLLGELSPLVGGEVDALLALMLLVDARRAARFDAAGELVLLAEQDRALWDRAEIDEGRRLVRVALQKGPPGSYALEAAIAAVHAEAAHAHETDWRQIVGLYERLHGLHRSPVVALNRAVAVAMAEGPARALPLVDELGAPLESYHLWHATRADLLRRLGRSEEAIAAYRRAHALAPSDAERRFLRRRLGELGDL